MWSNNRHTARTEPLTSDFVNFAACFYFADELKKKKIVKKTFSRDSRCFVRHTRVSTPLLCFFEVRKLTDSRFSGSGPFFSLRGDGIEKWPILISFSQHITNLMLKKYN